MNLTHADRSTLKEQTVELPIQAVLDRPPAPATSRAPRLYVLDLLRFLAAMAVVAYHLLFADARESWAADTAILFGAPLRQAASYGWLGVELFFMISGFVICMSSWGRSLSDFFTSRITRLMPAYLFAVLLTASVLLLWPHPGEKAPDLRQIIGNLTMTQNLLQLDNLDEPYWTLLIELKFYLLFLIVIAFGVTYRRVLLFCMVWTTLALIAHSADFKFLTLVVEPRFASYFVAGMALYLMHRFGQSLLLWCIVGFSFAVNAVMLDARVAPLVKAGLPMSWKASLALVTIFYLLMIGIALGWFARIQWRGLATIGALTYPLYLIHSANGRTVIRHLRDDVPPWLLLGGVVIGTLLLAYAVHLFVERPLSRALRNGLKSSFQQVRASSESTDDTAGAVPPAADHARPAAAAPTPVTR
ncbi:acyltransferase family protein [Micromonospora sp. NPDC007208]|uniref:acyltransferase family protein n=1 Tax=Micromonospora sp. NPDC007208 TaxID=3364236 RepID=UPI0036BBD2F1